MNTFTENMGIVLMIVSVLAIAIAAIVFYNKNKKNDGDDKADEDLLKDTKESNWGSIPDLKPKGEQ